MLQLTLWVQVPDYVENKFWIAQNTRLIVQIKKGKPLPSRFSNGQESERIPIYMHLRLLRTLVALKSFSVIHARRVLVAGQSWEGMNRSIVQVNSIVQNQTATNASNGKIIWLTTLRKYTETCLTRLLRCLYLKTTMPRMILTLPIIRDWAISRMELGTFKAAILGKALKVVQPRWILVGWLILALVFSFFFIQEGFHLLGRVS